MNGNIAFGNANPYQAKPTKTKLIIDNVARLVEGSTCHAYDVKQDSEALETIFSFAFTLLFLSLPNIARTEHIPIKIFWAISMILSTAAASYLTVMAGLSYFDYDVLVSFNLHREFSAEFPAVTFCNLNPINYYKYPQFIREIEDMYLGLLKEEYRNRTDVLDNMCDKSTKYFIKLQLTKNLISEDYLHTLDSMLISCYFNQKPCTKDDFYYYENGPYGNCYSFN